MKTITKKAYGKNIKITDARDNFSLAINNAYGNTEQNGTPTPDTPIEIKSVVLSEIKSVWKNFFDYTKFTNRAIASNNGILFVSNSPKRLLSNAVNLKKVGENVSVSWNTDFKLSAMIITNVAEVVTEISDFTLKYVENSSGNYTFTVEKEGYYTFYFAPIPSTDREVSAEEMNTAQLEYGTATDFEPYTESVATLSNPVTLNGLNGVQDYVDVKRGVEHHKYAYETYSDTSKLNPIFIETKNGFGKFSIDLPNASVLGADANMLCNIFTIESTSTSSEWNNPTKTVMMKNLSSVAGRVGLVIESITTIDELNSMLANTPMHIIYPLAEPIETPLPDADVEALKSLKTYDGVMHIFTDSEVEPTLEVEYTLLEAKEDWNYTDYILHTDYNRIVGNISYLKAYLDTLFIGLTNISTMEEKTAKSLIYAREINAIETALETLNLETYKFDIGDTKEYMANTRTLNFEDLNRIESAIFMLAKQMTSHKENLKRLAFRLGGQKGIRV